MDDTLLNFRQSRGVPALSSVVFAKVRDYDASDVKSCDTSGWPERSLATPCVFPSLEGGSYRSKACMSGWFVRCAHEHPPAITGHGRNSHEANGTT